MVCLRLSCLFAIALVCSATAVDGQTNTKPIANPTTKPPGSMDQSAVGDAFSAMFNPVSTPRVRTMGSIQRTNFLDELLATRGRLQVAFVIDGTDSMGSQLEGVQKKLSTLIRDLRRVVGKGLAVQMVIYRDVAAPSGPISFPLSVGKQAWAETDNDIASGLSKLTPESGAPYFYEQVDAGLYAALTELSWSQESDVNRWIILIGDAPPFKAGFQETENQALRRYETELLKRTAVEKNVRIHGLLCPSRDEDRKLYESVLPECRNFFTDMAGATGGLVLDLSNPSELRRIQSAAEEAVKDFVMLKPITQADLDFYKQAQKPVGKVRLAVLPFLDIKSMDFDPNNPMNQLAEEVRTQLDQKGIETASIVQVKNAFQYFMKKRQRPVDTEVPFLIGRELKVNYLIWRHPEPVAAGGFRAEVLNVRAVTEKTVTDVIDLRVNSGNNATPANVRLCSLILQSLASKSKSTNLPVAKVFSDAKFQTRLVSTSDDGAQGIQRARLYLQLSLFKKATEEASDTDLDEAIKELQSVKEKEQANPLWHNLMANAYFGKAQAERLRKNKSVGRNLMTLARDRSADAFKSNQSNKEFEADHYFFQGQFEKCAKVYESIVQESVSPDTIARARWMLVYLYIGDWGADKVGLQNLEKARQNIIALWATYPDAKESEALKLAMRWSEAEQRTLFEYLPIEDASPSDGQ